MRLYRRAKVMVDQEITFEGDKVGNYEIYLKGGLKKKVTKISMGLDFGSLATICQWIFCHECKQESFKRYGKKQMNF